MIAKRIKSKQTFSSDDAVTIAPAGKLQGFSQAARRQRVAIQKKMPCSRKQRM
jgi:hypothetical protein